MRVEGPRSSTSNRKSRSSDTAGAGFSLPANGSSQASPSTGAAPELAGVHGLDAILALQSVESGEDRSRRAVQHGHDLLDQLEALRADLLAGQISPQRLASLMSLLRARQDSNDATLSGLINDIDLRARVELAKLGVDL